jgi:hypothetical protein
MGGGGRKQDLIQKVSEVELMINAWSYEMCGIEELSSEAINYKLKVFTLGVLTLSILFKFV